MKQKLKEQYIQPKSWFFKINNTHNILAKLIKERENSSILLVERGVVKTEFNEVQIMGNFEEFYPKKMKNLKR